MAASLHTSLSDMPGSRTSAAPRIACALASLLAAALLVSMSPQRAGWMVVAPIWGLALLSAARPFDGLLALAGLGPVITIFSVIAEVLEHLPEPQAAVDGMFRVLEPGGELLLTTRFLFPIHDAPHDYFRYTKYGLRYLLRRFEILELREETDAVGTLAVLLQRIGMQAETLGWTPLRALWLVAAQAARPFSFLITREYGDSGRRRPERGIMTSGHVACRKPPR